MCASIMMRIASPKLGQDLSEILPSSLSIRKRAMDIIFELLAQAGERQYYGECVSQLAHAQQCAALAEQEGTPSALVEAPAIRRLKTNPIVVDPRQLESSFAFHPTCCGLHAVAYMLWAA